MLSKLNTKLDISRFFQSPTNISLANLIPRQIYRLYFIFLGLVYLLFRSDLRNRISETIHKIFDPEISFLKLMKIKKDIFCGLIDHYFEKMWNIYSPLEDFCKYIKVHTLIENRTWLDNSLRKDGGVLLISGHFGGIEYLTITLSVHGYKPAIIARFKTTKLIQRTLPRAKATNIEVINADEKNVFYKAVHALKKGKILITLCDEFSRWLPCDNKSITVFGECVLQDKTLDILHRRVKAPTCLGLMRRGKNGYKLQIHPIVISPDQQNKSIGWLSWKLLEQFILKDPGQWYQWHEMIDSLKDYKQKRHRLKASSGLSKSEIFEPTV